MLSGGSITEVTIGSGISAQGMQECQESLTARARVQKPNSELLFLDCVVRGDGEGQCVPPRRFFS